LKDYYTIVTRLLNDFRTIVKRLSNEC